ncbi:uncharacterized protein LOC142817245 isoform X1 [Rhipicephalus microplus]|uniref:uncharacterized protein LOC142817245 isoform X1 n=2 Tax=Rhipicephalus microplus TaxID=6941 RepID=UPI0023768089
MGITVTKGLCILLFLAAAFTFREARSCNGFHIPNTKRMMETKAVFGTLIRRCRKHLDDMAKHFNPKEFSKAVALACLSYNVCRDSIIEKTTRQLFLCLYNAASNKVGPFYTYLNVTEDFRQAVFDGMMCAGLTDILDSPITAIDDLATYSRWVALSFG